VRKETIFETDSPSLTSAPRRGSGFANEEVGGALRGAPQSLQNFAAGASMYSKLEKILLTAFAALQQISSQMTFDSIGIE
jgi:hypothetical protein